MSTIDFDKFNLDGLSLEDIEPVKVEEPKSNKMPESSSAIDTPENNESPNNESVVSEPEQAVEFIADASQNENSDEQMTCPKCELQQMKAEQCSDCGIYVEKALAQMGKSKIQITATKF